MITKICGITKEENLNCCEKNNVDFFGMIFYTPSPRNISIINARKLVLLSKKLKIKAVGVFVNESFDNIKNTITNLELKYIQLHGNENEEYIKSLKNLNIKIIKKISIADKGDLKELKKYKLADYILFDYKPKKEELPGGNSKSFDWNILNNLDIGKPWFLSGGINLDNISIIKSHVKPYGIDLSSGVEKKLGIKDNDIINNLMGKLKSA